MSQKKIVFVAHCVLNQLSVVKPLARATGAYNRIVEILLAEDIAVVQLPCPEMLALGLQRPSRDLTEYDTEEYRNLCEKWAMHYRRQMEAFRKDGVQILGVIGIHESPTCSIKNPTGIFMRYFMDEKMPYLEVPTDYVEGKPNVRFLTQLRKWIVRK